MNGPIDDVPRDPHAIAAAFADMLSLQGLPLEAEAEIAGRALAALALSTAAPDRYVDRVLGTLRRELLSAAGMPTTTRAEPPAV